VAKRLVASQEALSCIGLITGVNFGLSSEKKKVTGAVAGRLAEYVDIVDRK
jgi:hypothetical protein